ncbi:MAG: hypothetical protein EOO77_24845 [Oxalobacteraceae bacterium]|nr:MAG: hypothetical protein EOO77_24845 [Oxalobacteraceae bacterium]
MTDQQEAVALLKQLLDRLTVTFPENQRIFRDFQAWADRIGEYPPSHPMLLGHLYELTREVKAWSITADVMDRARVG